MSNFEIRMAMLNFTDLKSLPKIFSYLEKIVIETFLSMIGALLKIFHKRIKSFL